MAWWNRFFNLKSQSPIVEMKYRVAFKLYSEGAEREVEVREFSNDSVYIVERERIEGGMFKDRHSGKMVGPFPSPEVAEKFIVATPWFCGRDA
jgi:hypothetical protein